jgi:hypothetical protein
LYALIDRKNRLPGSCFAGFPTAGAQHGLRQKWAFCGNRFKTSNLPAVLRNIAFNSLTSKIRLLCQLVLEQIQISLGHASIVTTERYLGVRQDLQDAPCDHLGLRLDVVACKHKRVLLDNSGVSSSH